MGVCVWEGGEGMEWVDWERRGYENDPGKPINASVDILNCKFETNFVTL